MKKILVIFCCMFGLLPISGFARNGIENQCIGGSGTYRNNDDGFCYEYREKSTNPAQPGIITHHCFQADTNVCMTDTVVCILGTETRQTSEKYGASLVGKRRCAKAYATNKGGDDTWFKYPRLEFGDCETTKWAKNDDIGKNNEVMIINGKPLTSKNGYPMQWWVKYSDSGTNYPDICVGYYCKSDGKYAEPCDDGTCGPCSTSSPSPSNTDDDEITTNDDNGAVTDDDNGTVTDDDTSADTGEPAATDQEREENRTRIEQIKEKLKQ